jgi:XTP/dITP diphosphohydrolase
MQDSKIIFVTSNKGKAREYERILDRKISLCPLELLEIQAIEVEEVVTDKVSRAYDKLKKPVFIEDTGLYLEGMNGLPGALIKHFLERLSLQEICDLVKNERRALAKTCVAYQDGSSSVCFSGEIRGSITAKPRGAGGFGWDAIFVPEGQEKTFAEMSEEEKSLISMRAIAGKKFKQFLSSQITPIGAE